jgi:hypothetical protein
VVAGAAVVAVAAAVVVVASSPLLHAAEIIAITSVSPIRDALYDFRIIFLSFLEAFQLPAGIVRRSI